MEYIHVTDGKRSQDQQDPSKTFDCNIEDKNQKIVIGTTLYMILKESVWQSLAFHNNKYSQQFTRPSNFILTTLARHRRRAAVLFSFPVAGHRERSQGGAWPRPGGVETDTVMWRGVAGRGGGLHHVRHELVAGRLLPAVRRPVREPLLVVIGRAHV